MESLFLFEPDLKISNQETLIEMSNFNLVLHFFLVFQDDLLSSG